MRRSEKKNNRKRQKVNEFRCALANRNDLRFIMAIFEWNAAVAYSTNLMIFDSIKFCWHVKNWQC